MKLVKRPFLLLTTYLIISLLTLSYLFISAQPQEDKSNYTFNQARLLTNPVLSTIEENYTRISDTNVFADIIQPHLEELSAGLEIIDTGGRVLYSSEDAAAFSMGRTVDLKSHLNYDASFAAGAGDLVKFSFPLVQDNTQVANAVFLLPKDLIQAEDPIGPWRFITPVALLLTAILLAFILLQHSFAKKVSQPLHQLNSAVSQVARGNFDGRIQQIQDNELGRVCRAFDIMRLELRDSLERQRDYDKSRKELITKISHDLKTPVSSIKAYVEGLKDGIANDPATWDKYLTVIDRKTESLARLIDDLLQHSLQELGQMRIEKREVYSRDLLEAILEPIQIQFANSSVSFRIDGELPNILISADPARLEQVIVNLVHNARKYTADGGEIVFSARNKEYFLEISLRDTGAGISRQDLPHIFDNFYRSQKFARDIEGSGLGLAICKYIVEEHGGKINVHSQPGRGSTFSFTIAKA